MVGRGKPSKRSRKEAEDDVEDAVSADEEDDAEVSEDDEEEEEEPVKKPVKKKAAKPSKKADEKPKKKKKDPNEPKRGMSAFMFFSNAKRAEVKEDNPGIAFGEVGKKLGEMWKALDSDGRKTFDEQAAKDKSRYEKEIAAYRAKQGGDDGQAFRGSGKEAELALSDEDGDTELSEDDEEHEPPPKKAAKRKKKDPNEPKRGMSAFMFFANAKRAEVKEDNPGIAFGEIGKKLGEMWKTLDSDGRKSFDEQAAKDKSRYATEIALYRAKQ